MIEAAQFTRLSGALLCVMGVIGLLFFGLAAASAQFGTMLAVGVWLAYCSYCGVRLIRLSVVCDDLGLTVRNRFRTRCVAWENIQEVAFTERGRMPLLQWQMQNRACGVVTLTDKTEFFLDATDSFRVMFHGYLFSKTPSRAESDVAAIRSRWQAHVASTPGRAVTE